MTESTSGIKPESVLLYCRPGFEKECAADIIEQAGLLGVYGYVKADEGSGFARFMPQGDSACEQLRQNLRFGDLMFARQLVYLFGSDQDLPPEDRLTPLMEIIRESGLRFSELFLETADTNEAKSLSVFLRKFATPLRRALEHEQLLGNRHLPRLHAFFLSATSVSVGLSNVTDASPWLMGIPRLKFPRGAPSRSTLKLDEAFQVFVQQPDQDLRPGMTAVDLGAAPGGWTWQLVHRHIRTIAVDNGALDPVLLDSGIVEHLRVDGFRFRPVRPVDWLVCDMVEQPSRIAALIGDWLAQRHCKYAIFNLKLPMKKRYETVQLCREMIESRLIQANRHYTLEFRQLYHDRAEITGYVVCLDG